MNTARDMIVVIRGERVFVESVDGTLCLEATAQHFQDRKADAQACLALMRSKE